MIAYHPEKPELICIMEKDAEEPGVELLGGGKTDYETFYRCPACGEDSLKLG